MAGSMEREQGGGVSNNGWLRNARVQGSTASNETLTMKIGLGLLFSLVVTGCRRGWRVGVVGRSTTRPLSLSLGHHPTPEAAGKCLLACQYGGDGLCSTAQRTLDGGLVVGGLVRRG